MNNMKKIKLGDYIKLLTDYHSGGSYKTLKENTKILYKKDYAMMVRTLNFENNDFTNNLIYVDKKSYDFLEYSHIQENDILINKIANPGSVYIMPKYDGKVTCGMNLFLLRFKNINQRYMYYVLKNSEDYIKNQAHGTTTKTITKDEIKNLNVYIHLLKEDQDRAERILTTIDEKIDNNNRIIIELDNISKTLYNYWFLQYEFPNENGKPYKSAKGKMIWNKKIKKEIPVNWNIKMIGDIIVEKEKSTIQVSDAKKQMGDIPFFTSGNEILGVNEALTNGVNCFLNTGGNADVKYYEGECSYSTDTWCITAKDNLSYYLIYYLLSIKDELNIKYFQGTGLKHLQKPLLRNKLIVLPNKKILDEFSNIVKYNIKYIANKYKENQELKKLRDYLLPLLMNGQVGFKD